MIYTYYRQYGNKILLRYIDEDGETKTSQVDFYKPKLYVKSNQETTHQSIYGDPLRQVEFNSINEAKRFADEYKDIPDMGVSGNSNYANQFIIELFDGKTPKFDINQFNIGMFDIEVDADEFPMPEEAKYVVNAFSLYSSKENKFYARAIPHKEGDNWNQEDSDDSVKKLDVDFKLCNDETELLMEFLTMMSTGDYHMISGWNSEGFDVPYLVNRCRKIVGETTTRKMLSPFGKIDERESVDKWGKRKTKYILSGLPHMDFMDMYKKHTFTPRESFKLDFIASEELGEKKVDYEDTLHDLYREDFQKFVDYNIQDSNLIKRLDDKLGLFQLTLSLAYISLSNYEDTLGTVKIWEQLVAKFLYSKGNKVPLFRKEAITDDREFDGAFVKEPVPGFYKWIISVDLNSLYPHIEQQWNIGPETHVPYDRLPSELQEIVDNYNFNDILSMKVAIRPLLEKHKLTMAANFEFYRLDEMSFFSEIKRYLYKERKGHKKDMLGFEQKKVDATNPNEEFKYESLESAANSMQMGLKILLNGGYGALGNSSFLYYKVENAEAITLSGQFVNKYVSSKVDSFLQNLFNNKNKRFWVYSDTDSAYLTLEDFVDTLDASKGIEYLVDQVDRFCEEVIAPEIRDLCQEICDYMNCYEQRMFWEREVISDIAVWVAKKKYVMSVLDSEGTKYYKEPKIKIMGMESVKSSTPAWARKALKDCYTVCLRGTKSDFYEKLNEIKEAYYSKTPNEIAIPTRVNGLEKYHDPETIYGPGAQAHVKAALFHNHIVKKEGYKQIGMINSGDSIKYLILDLPNPTGFPVIGFDSYLPKEFNVEKYIDKGTMYEKSFMSALRIFLYSIKWEEEEQVSLF